jgi:UDP-N-acetylmuramate dehydrogenase
MIFPLPVSRNISLRSLNTFGIDAQADAYLPIESLAQLTALREEASLARLPRLLLGGGSNILLTGDFHGLVLHSCSRGIAPIDEQGDTVRVRAAAGETWQTLVDWTLQHQLGGLENLSLIPGSVGAAPIQNIGAYGAEVASTIDAVTVFDFDSGACKTLDRSACAFGYRDSIFKRSLRERVMILDVTFALTRRWQPNLRYAELADALAAIAEPTMQQVSDAVSAIRRRKLPDPAVIGNAGSFFKNPVVERTQRDQLLAHFPTLVSHDQSDGTAKLAAAWLIDQCGWKGRALGAAGVHQRQPLVLINRGGARGVDIVRLAEAIAADVWQRFAVKLEPEPFFV